MLIQVKCKICNHIFECSSVVCFLDTLECPKCGSLKIVRAETEKEKKIPVSRLEIVIERLEKKQISLLKSNQFSYANGNFDGLEYALAQIKEVIGE